MALQALSGDQPNGRARLESDSAVSLAIPAFVLTLVWAALMLVVPLTGQLQRQNIGALLIELSLAGGLVASAVLTVALFPPAAWLLRGFGALLGVAGVVGAAAIVVWQHNSGAAGAFGGSPRLAGTTANALLVFFVPLLIGSAGLVTTRTAYVQVKRWSKLIAPPFRAVYLFTREQHTWFGVIMLAVVTAHSAYFLLRPGRTFAEWTGVASYVLLIVLAVAGLRVIRQGRRKLVLHQQLAIGFGVALLLHVPKLLVFGAPAVIALSAAGMVMMAFVAALAKRGS